MLLYPKHVKSRDRAGPAERAGICYGQSVTTVVFEYIRRESVATYRAWRDVFWWCPRGASECVA